VLSSREIYVNAWIHVREDKILRDGCGEGIFGVVEMKHGSSVLAMNDQEEVYLVREYKYAFGGDTLEVISGGLEQDEHPLDGAKRELREEVGFEAEEWTDLGVLNPYTTAIHCPNHLFLARGLRHVGASPDEMEILETVHIPFAEAVDRVMRGEITHGASVVAILKTEMLLRAARR